jgi:F-type H+-transporting ATPase subunit b
MEEGTVTMAEKQDSPQGEGTILSHSLSDYREKVGEIIRKENERFSQLAQEQAKEIIADACRKAEEIVLESQKKASENIAEGQKKAERIIADCQKHAVNLNNEVEQQANKKSSEIIEKAQQKAKQVIQEAEESAKKEAKSRIKSQEEKILTQAKEEATSIITEARKNAEKETSEIIEKTKMEAQERFEEEIAKFRAEAQAQTTQIRIEAEKKAAELVDDIMKDNKEFNEMIIGITKKSETILEKLGSEMQVEAAEMTRRVVAARQKIEQKIAAFTGKSQAENVIQRINGNSNKNSALWIILKGEQSEQSDGGGPLFKGQMELKTLSSIDYLLVRKLKGFLIQVPNVKYLGESASEEGTLLSFEMKEPLPIMDILSKIPWVENVETQGDNIKLILN